MSSWPAIGIAIAGLLGLGLVVAAARTAHRARLSDGHRISAVTAVLFGLGIFCLLAVGSGFRHFGGSVPVDAGLTAYRCDPWWIQMGSTAGSSDGRAGPSRHCRQAAVSATLPAVGQSAAGGMAAALLGYCFVLVRRRHVDRAVRRVVISSS